MLFGTPSCAALQHKGFGVCGSELSLEQKIGPKRDMRMIGFIVTFGFGREPW